MTPAQQLRQQASGFRRLSNTLIDWRHTRPRERRIAYRERVQEAVADADEIAHLMDRVARMLEEQE